MIYKRRARTFVAALVTFSLVLSMLGIAAPAFADVTGDENSQVSEESGNLTAIDPPARGEGTTDGTVSEDNSGEEESTEPPVGDEGENQNGSFGEGSETDETTGPPINEGGAGEPSEGANEDDTDVPAINALNAPMNTDVSTVSVSVTMTDGGDVPSGLEAWLYPDGSWDPIEVVPLTYDGTVATATFTGDISYDRYGVWVIGNGYSSGQTAVVDAPEENYAFTFNRLTGSIAITLNASDGGDIPEGISWSASHAQDGVLANGVITEPLPSGSVVQVWPQPLPFGVYDVTFSPPASPSGRYVESQTLTVNLTNAWVPDQSVNVNLEIIVPMSTGTFSVSMSDGNPLPNGLEWMIVVSGSWDPIASGEVTAGVINYVGTVDDPVPYGLYQLWITGNGYSSGQVVNVQSDSFHHDFELDRLSGDLAVTVTTNDGADIPAGTAWEILDVNGVVLQNGTFATSAPSGTVLTLDNPFEFGVYTLNIVPDTATLGTMSLSDLPRDILPFTTTITITDPWSTEYPVTAELQWAQSGVTFTVSMSDGGPLPNGLEWMLVQPPNWDPLASGDIPAGEITFAGEIDEPAPYGSYQLWFTGNGYSSGYVVTVNSTTTHRDFVLDRLVGDVTVTLDTSDDADIPAGTIWTITDSAGAVVQQGELTEPAPVGSTLPITNPIEFDVYTLSIDADGYFPFTMEMNITNSWVSEYAFTATLQEELSKITFTVSMSDGGALPNDLEWMLVPGGSWDPLESGVVTTGEITFEGEVSELMPFGVYQLWITGHGYSSGQVLNVNSAETHHDFVLDRLYADVTVILDTSDDGDIPAGTTWTLVDSAGTVVQEGELAESLADGSTLPLTNPLEFDVYTLVVDAEGYHTVTMELSVTNPWLGEMEFTVYLVSDREPAPDPDEKKPAPVTKLPETGSGESGANQVSMLVLAGSVMTLLAGCALRLRHGFIRP